MKNLKEEKAQGAIEHLLLAGGIIVAAIVIFAIYSSVAGCGENEYKTIIGNIEAITFDDDVASVQFTDGDLIQFSTKHFEGIWITKGHLEITYYDNQRESGCGTHYPYIVKIKRIGIEDSESVLNDIEI